jgi:hypothetical protein
MSRSVYYATYIVKRMSYVVKLYVQLWLSTANKIK